MYSTRLDSICIRLRKKEREGERVREGGLETRIVKRVTTSIVRRRNAGNSTAWDADSGHFVVPRMPAAMEVQRTHDPRHQAPGRGGRIGTWRGHLRSDAAALVEAAEDFPRDPNSYLLVAVRTRNLRNLTRISARRPRSIMASYPNLLTPSTSPRGYDPWLLAGLEASLACPG